jgi:hypothetical protein
MNGYFDHWTIASCPFVPQQLMEGMSTVGRTSQSKTICRPVLIARLGGLYSPERSDKRSD